MTSQPGRHARAMLATAGGVLALSGGFVALWLAAAALFHRSARAEAGGAAY